MLITCNFYSQLRSIVRTCGDMFNFPHSEHTIYHAAKYSVLPIKKVGWSHSYEELVLTISYPHNLRYLWTRGRYLTTICVGARVGLQERSFSRFGGKYWKITIESNPGASCFTLKFSSCTGIQKGKAVYMTWLTGNFSPYIENEPVPSLFIKSPPVIDVNYGADQYWSRPTYLGTWSLVLWS